MLQPDSSDRPVQTRWRAWTLALFVVGLEIIAVVLLFVGRDLLAFRVRGIIALFPYIATILAVGAALAGAAFLLTRRQINTSWTLRGITLFVTGILILAPAGLCVSYGAYGLFSTPDPETLTTRRAQESVLIMTAIARQVLIISSISIAIGIAFAFAGLKRRRRG